MLAGNTRYSIRDVQGQRHHQSGSESRGFIMGGALAARLGARFVMARKPGKLPAEVVEETY